MPISSERKSGFGLSRWERNYLRCRYKAHRSKVAAAEPAIDANSPPNRPHVRHKQKKALMEERRQILIMHENLRVLNRTAEIMSCSDPIFTRPDSNSNSQNRQSLTSVANKNVRVIFQWFLHKFGKYVPWWSHISY